MITNTNTATLTTCDSSTMFSMQRVV